MSTRSSLGSYLSSASTAPWLLSIALLLLLIGTRSQFVVEHLHFSPALRAPDATLAVFFLAGLWIASAPYAAVLLGAAALADQIAFAGGVPDWCFTAAYVCLIPAYLTMWFAGRICRGVDFMSPAGASKLIGVLVVACFIEFVISSGSFFLWSGYFPAMPAAEYWSKTIGYYPSYLGWAAVYVAAALAIASIVRAFRTESAQHTH
jgi:hypothetical protein